MLGEPDEALDSGRPRPGHRRVGSLTASSGILATTFSHQAHGPGATTSGRSSCATGTCALPGDWVSSIFGTRRHPIVCDRWRGRLCLAELGRFARRPARQPRRSGSPSRSHHAETVGLAMARAAPPPSGDSEGAPACSSTGSQPAGRGIVAMFPHGRRRAGLPTQPGEPDEALTLLREGDEQSRR